MFFSVVCCSRRLLVDLQWTVKRHLHCSGVVVGSLTNSFVTNSIRAKEPNESIDVVKARIQHQRQIEQLSELVNGNIVQIPAIERHPDMVFTEDPAVILNGKAIIVQMKPKTRSGECGPMKETLQNHALKLGIKEIVEMGTTGAYLDGGDVLFTGREFLIGLSERTNALGIEEFAKHFSSWPITGIKIPKTILHLKSLSSLCDVNSIAIASTTEGQEVWKEIERLAKYRYRRFAFPDNNGANCIFINGSIIHCVQEEYPESFKVWELFSNPQIPLANSELSKADGSLTCTSFRIIETD